MKKFVSLTLIKENLKRFWGFSAVAFIAYFLSSGFYILLNGVDTIYMLDNVINIVSGSYVAFSMFDVIVPVVASVLVFGYLARVNSTGVMHAMPFSRAGLYISNYVSGLILSIAPVILNAICNIFIRAGVCYSYVDYEGVIINSADRFTVKIILLGMMIDLLSVFFTYSIACIAGVISGNRVIHLLTGFTLNFILPVTWLSFTAFELLMLDGFVASDSSEYVALAMHPGLNAYREFFLGVGQHMNVVAYIIYVCVAVILSVVGYILYSQRKMERAGDSYVFGWTKYIVAFFFTYLPAAGLGLLLSEFGGNTYVLGLVIGGVVGFIIGWMIINKSFRIINMKTLKAFLISAGVTAIIALVFSLDLTGYGKKIPQASDVESVDFNFYGNGYYGSDLYGDCLYDSKNIEHMISFHKDVIESDRNQENDNYVSFYICYHLKNGLNMKREYYDFPEELFYESEDIKAVFESEEIGRTARELLEYNINYTEIEIMSAEYYYNSFDPYVDAELRQKELCVFNKYENNDIKKELIDALVEDLSERTFDERKNAHEPWAYFVISCDNQSEQSEYGDYINSYYVSDEGGVKRYNWESTIAFNDDYENLLAVLEKYGLLERIIQ